MGMKFTKRVLAALVLCMGFPSRPLCGQAPAGGTPTPTVSPVPAGPTPTPTATIPSAGHSAASSLPSSLPEVVVTGKGLGLPGLKYSGPLLDIPQSAVVLDQQTLEDRGMTSFREALVAVPGVSLQTSDSPFDGDVPNIRGFSALTDFFMDGLRDFGPYFRDPFDTAEIDVLKGPSGLLFGQGSTGGVISQATKSPLLQSFYAGSLGVGTAGNRRATADLNVPLPSWGPGAAFRLNLVADQEGTAEKDIVQNATSGLAPTLAFGIGTPTRLTLSLLHLYENGIPDYGVPWLMNNPAPLPRNLYYGFIDDFVNTQVDIETLRFEQDWGEAITLSEKARYSNYYDNLRLNRPGIAASEALSIVAGTLPLSQALETPSERALTGTDTDLDSQTELTVRFQTAGSQHCVSTGTEGIVQTSQQSRSNYSGVPSESLLQPVETWYFSGTPGPTTKTSVSLSTLSFYAMDTIGLDPQWTLVGGLRWDGDWAGFSQSLSGTTTRLASADDMWNWRAGIVFKPRPNGSVYFVSGTSTDPSIEQLTLSAATEAAPPEQNITFEAGSKWDFMDGQLHLTGDVFWDEQTNSRVLDPTTGLDVDAGDERVDGFELSVTGDVTKEWNVVVSYAFLDSEYVDFINGAVTLTGYPLYDTPQNSLDVWSTYEFFSGFQLGGGMDWISSRNAGAFAANGLLQTVPGYATLNATARWQADKNIGFQANLTNITDAYYFDAVDPVHVVPGAGRTLVIASNLEF